MKDELAYSANHCYREGYDQAKEDAYSEKLHKIAYAKGRADAIEECIAIIKEMHNMYDVVGGDWSNCYQIIDVLKGIKEKKNE